MKTFFGKSWMAALLAGACCVMVACDDDDNGGGQTPPPTEPDITAVCGDYAGTMSVVEAAPAADGEEPAGTAIEAAVSEAEISFTDFPIRDLVVKVLGTEEGVDEIVAAIGQVDYRVPYTAVMSEDKAMVAMTLAPEALKLTLPSGGRRPISRSRCRSRPRRMRSTRLSPENFSSALQPPGSRWAVWTWRLSNPSRWHSIFCKNSSGLVAVSDGCGAGFPKKTARNAAISISGRRFSGRSYFAPKR